MRFVILLERDFKFIFKFSDRIKNGIEINYFYLVMVNSN